MGQSSHATTCLLGGWLVPFLKSIASEFHDEACNCCTPLFFICRSLISVPYYPIWTIILKKGFYFVVHLLESFQQFLFSSHKVTPIVRPYCPNVAPSFNESSQSLYKGICLHTVTNFKVHSFACQTSKDGPISFKFCSPFYDQKRTKHV